MIVKFRATLLLAMNSLKVLNFESAFQLKNIVFLYAWIFNLKRFFVFAINILWLLLKSLFIYLFIKLKFEFP